MKILLFGFLQTHSSAILPYFKTSTTTHTVKNGNIKELQNLIDQVQPTHVIGLGDYSGRDKTLMRLETISKNKFRNNKIDETGKEEYKLYTPATTPEGFKVSQGLGNSYCNLAAYQLSNNPKNNNVKISFLHIHKSTTTDQSIKTIENLLSVLE